VLHLHISQLYFIFQSCNNILQSEYVIVWLWMVVCITVAKSAFTSTHNNHTQLYRNLQEEHIVPRTPATIPAGYTYNNRDAIYQHNRNIVISTWCCIFISLNYISFFKAVIIFSSLSMLLCGSGWWFVLL
jgi:hypothetical protein